MVEKYALFNAIYLLTLFIMIINVKKNIITFCRSNTILQPNFNTPLLLIFKEGIHRFLRTVMDFCGPLYGSVTQPSDVTVYANTEIVGQHRHYRAI